VIFKKSLSCAYVGPITCFRVFTKIKTLQGLKNYHKDCLLPSSNNTSNVQNVAREGDYSQSSRFSLCVALVVCLYILNGFRDRVSEPSNEGYSHFHGLLKNIQEEVKWQLQFPIDPLKCIRIILKTLKRIHTTIMPIIGHFRQDCDDKTSTN